MQPLLLAIISLILIAPNVSAQEFEAASVKPHPAGCVSGPMARSGIEETKALIQIENMSLKSVVALAYGVKGAQFVGPGWLDAVCFDIVAKPPAGYSHPQLQPLLRNLLADRFKLTVHHDSKPEPAYALLIAKGGPKFHPAVLPRGFFTARPGLIDGTQISMKQLTAALIRPAGRIVVDETGLEGVYDLKLEWAPDDPPPAHDGGNEKTEPAEPGPSFFTALHDQLGLSMKPRKIPMDIVIVDHIEKEPTGN